MSTNRKRKNAKTAPSNNESDDEVDRRGRPSRFNDLQKKWFRSTNVDHDRKVAPHNGKLVDDSDLKDWIEGKWKQFEVEFPGHLDKPGEPVGETEKVRIYRLTCVSISLKTNAQTFKERFKNRLYYIRRKANLPNSTPALVDLMATRNPKGYVKFTEAHSAEVTRELNEDNDMSKIPQKDHIGLFQKSMGVRWKMLAKEDKEKWNNAAKVTPKSDPDVVFKCVPIYYYYCLDTTLIHCDRNQETLLQLLSDLLLESQGFAAHQCGDSAHMLLSTFRDKDGMLQNHM